MDVSKEIVAKWTRYQRRKADEELLKKAKILKDQKNKRKNGSSEKPMPKRRSKNGSNEACSSDVEILSGISGDNSDEEANSSSGVEILDEQYIPPKRRRQLPRSRISKRHSGIAIDKISVPSPGSRGIKKSQRTHKDIVASGKSNSLSISIEDYFSNAKVDDSVLSGGESGDHQNNKVENYNGVGNSSSLFSLELSDEHDGGGSDNQNDTEGEESQNQERNMESDDSNSNSNSSVSISESSSEEDGDESDDDYNVDESCNSGSDSDSDSESEYDDSSQYNEGKAIGGTTAATVKRNPVGENREAGKFHLQKKRKLPADLDTGVGYGNEKDDVKEVRWKRKSQQELREKFTKLDSDKISSNSDGNDELDGAGWGDEHLSEKSSRSRGDRKESNCKKHPSRAVDLMNILSDSIWEEGDALKEKLFPLEEGVCYNDYHSLPLKFRFEDEETAPTPAENDEEQKEVDSLFAALEMGWIQDDIGSTKLSKEDNDDEDEDAKMSNPAESCQLGHHFLILDEKIGVICKYCRIVQQEMKHVLPDIKIPSRRRQEWYAFYNDKSFLSHEFQFGHLASGDHHAFINDTEGPVLNIIPAYLRRQMYPHQLDGFQFLWKNIAGATMVEDLKTSLPKGGTGCIISHAPGTGKSFLTIVFLLTFMEVHPTCRPVIIAPLTMLRAWGDELKRWKVNIPFHNLNDAELSGEENVMAASIIQQVGSSTPDGKKRDRDYKRMVKLYSWIKDKKSILGIGYSLFEKLTGEHRKGNNNNDNNIAEKFRKILLELPGVLILDEGHTPRNKKSLLWKTLTKVETGRRIILSGTPFQNNFDELYNTFYLANPKFVESISAETCKSDAKSKRNLAKGRWDSLTSLIDKNAVDAVEKLRAMMDPFVHVHKGNILQESLPGLRDTLILLNPTEMQKQLLPNIPDNILEKVYLGSLVSVHPFLVAQHDEFSSQRSMLEELELSPEAGVKTQFVIEMVRLSNARDEKVLIFSEFIDPLNFLMKQLTSYFCWEEGKEVLYMDGKLEDKQRQWVINSFNARNSEAKVLLASTKACSEGISLVGASRVVLLDVVWNPSVERQAISRAYRLGQKKFVYIYRLVMSGTVEIEKFQRQAKKDRISELVFCCPFDHNNGDNHKSKLARNMSGDDILDAMVNHKNLSHIFEEILPQAKQSNVVSSQKL